MEFNMLNLDELLATGIDPSLYQYYENLLNKRTIIFNQDIDETAIERLIIPLKQMDNDGSGKPITLEFNTDGGDIYYTMAICSAIDSIKNCQLNINIIGLGASGGAFVSMAGFNNPKVKKTCSPWTVFLIHTGSMGFDGSTNAVKDTVQFHNKYWKLISNYVTSHSNITEKEFKSKTRTEWWMTADEALKYGIVDEIV